MEVKWMFLKKSDSKKNLKVETIKIVRDQVNKGRIRLKHCGTYLQLADIMTKALKTDKFKLLRNILGVVHI